MTFKELLETVRNWDGSSTDEDPQNSSKYSNILDHLQFLGGGEWKNYIPANSPQFSKNFMARLAAWIGSIDKEADQKLLLEYAERLSFFSHEDFQALYLSAFNGPITRWVIQQANLKFYSPCFSEELKSELYQQTWYCPITDSMGINEFYHVNHISGIEDRPCFATLAKLYPQSEKSSSDMAIRLQKFMKKPDRRSDSLPLKRLVLLEDFVGSGTQMKNAIEWAAKKLNIQILVVPLIICDPGQKTLNTMINNYQNLLSSSPIIRVNEGELLGPKSKEKNSWTRSSEMESLAEEIFENTGGETAFGYEQTGCSVVTYSNTPNNTLPLIHNQPKSGTWNPLFPRSSRV